MPPNDANRSDKATTRDWEAEVRTIARATGIEYVAEGHASSPGPIDAIVDCIRTLQDRERKWYDLRRDCLRCGSPAVGPVGSNYCEEHLPDEQPETPGDRAPALGPPDPETCSHRWSGRDGFKRCVDCGSETLNHRHGVDPTSSPETAPKPVCKASDDFLCEWLDCPAHPVAEAQRTWLELPMFPNDLVAEQDITCIFCRSLLPCEYALLVKRDGERALVGVHERCVEPLRRRNANRRERAPTAAQIRSADRLARGVDGIPHEDVLRAHREKTKTSGEGEVSRSASPEAALFITTPAGGPGEAGTFASADNAGATPPDWVEPPCTCEHPTAGLYRCTNCYLPISGQPHVSSDSSDCFAEDK